METYVWSLTFFGLGLGGLARLALISDISDISDYLVAFLCAMFSTSSSSLK